jgi:RNA 3'-terminal phosphate cyclase (ATP)
LKSSKNNKPSPMGLDSHLSEKLTLNILSISRSLPEHVSRRQAETAGKFLALQGLGEFSIETNSTGESLSPGSSITIYEKGASTFIGASSLGERGKKAELVGETAAQDFLEETKSVPNVDSHLADMLVTLLSCVEGKSRFRTSKLTTHFTTNCEVAKKLTGCEIRVSQTSQSWLVEIAGSPEKPN